LVDVFILLSIIMFFSVVRENPCESPGSTNESQRLNNSRVASQTSPADELPPSYEEVINLNVQKL
jgi:hypothetical protein